MTSSNGSTDPAKPISSIRQDVGSNIEAVLELGQMLAERMEGHDLLGQWMSHHLAELVIAARDDAVTNVAQRTEILETILKIWDHRYTYPSGNPLEDFGSVLAALDRLGNDQPWAFSRLFEAHQDGSDSDILNLPLVVTATELESLTRETLVYLIWLAVHDTGGECREWLEVADRAAWNLESMVSSRIWRLRRRAQLRRQVTRRDTVNTEGTTEDEPADAPADNGNQVDTVSPHRDSLDTGADSDNSPTDRDHIQRLREMASLLNNIADSLDAQSTQSDRPND